MHVLQYLTPINCSINASYYPNHPLSSYSNTFYLSRSFSLRSVPPFFYILAHPSVTGSKQGGMPFNPLPH